MSFLSRLVGAKKKDASVDNATDADSLFDEHRPEGNDAEIFSQPIDNMSYNPSHPQPPAYIKVRSRHKKRRDFDRLFLAQELRCSSPKASDTEKRGSNKLRRKSSAALEAASKAATVWAMEFSKDGKYLAAAGADRAVRVWAVLSSPEDRHTHEQQEAEQSSGSTSEALHLNAPVFQSKALREYEGHTSTILDLAWSKNNFLLSSSMDKTVRLWHVSRSECLCTFKHTDFVPSIAFHPKDDRFFLAGSLDSKLRLWSIPDKSVAYTATLPDMITAVTFTPDGRFAMAGCLSGLTMFYETEGLKYQTQIHVRSTHGKNAKGSKITSIQASYYPPHNASGDIKLLITSNDSRIRLYNFRDKSMELKLKGNENNCSQIRATISDDGRYVLSGSEDRKAYIWSLEPEEGDKRDKMPMEMFEAHDTITTAVCMAPAKTKILLGRSEDPVYDLCNPPPVTLMSRAERAESQTSSRPPTENGSVLATPIDAEAKFKLPEQSPAYLTRSSHKEGNIIVTADFTGRIKVFRQDCAWSKRRSDDWDKASVFSKRAPSGKQGRTPSVTTKASQKSLRSGRDSTSTQAPSDRILSWRQGIASTPNINGSVRSSNATRSVSPRKSLGQISTRSNQTKPDSNLRSATATSESLPSTDPTSTGGPSPQPPPAAQIETVPDLEAPLQKDDSNPLMLQGGHSYLFWNTAEWRERADRAHNRNSASDTDLPSAGHLAPDRLPPHLERQNSVVSALSDERSSTDEFDDAREAVGPDDEIRCKQCGSASFKARLNKDRGGTQLVCTECGVPA